uniref:ASCH domain-containing protein n=1 Tax=viral metagenome TaxID=1070528 RepID=A0A6M3IYD8_9ZZZZ
MKGLSLSGQMIVPWLAGNKTVTRRLMNPQPGFWVGGIPYREHIGESDHDIEIKPRYLPGETVYIKESCYICGSDMDGAPLAEPPVVYRADGARKSDEYSHFRSPRFMPEWASRSHALIVSVRPDQINEITEEEVEREGVGLTEWNNHPEWPKTAGFAELWESLHPGSWEKNEWCFVYTLKKLDKRVDAPDTTNKSG